MKKIKANVPTRKKIKLNWFKAKCDFNIERKIEIQYTANDVSSNKLKWDAIVKYVLVKVGDLLNKDIPSNSPMTLYKNGMPFLFLNTAESSGTKINSENMIDDDIIVDDDIVNISEGVPKVTYEDASNPKEQIEVRTRYDKISRKITIENKLNNEIDLTFDFKQTKDVTFVKSEPEPSLIEEPNYKYNIKIPSESKSSIVLELQAKIVSRITKIKPEFLKPPKE
ncbi:MAG: hypothetical protein ACFFAU_20220 [Candidatus Hodarchaeota archaeon]